MVVTDIRRQHLTTQFGICSCRLGKLSPEMNGRILVLLSSQKWPYTRPSTWQTKASVVIWWPHSGLGTSVAQEPESDKSYSCRTLEHCLPGEDIQGPRACLPYYTAARNGGAWSVQGHENLQMFHEADSACQSASRFGAGNDAR